MNNLAQRQGLSTAGVAAMAGVHRDTLLRWLREGVIPEPRRDRKGWRTFTAHEAERIVHFAKLGISSAADQSSERSVELSALDKIDWDFFDAKTAYLTHGLHPYPAKFIPQIPNALIQALSSVGETVADIFCGSGTTLVEALILKRNAVGIDANPLACLITQAKTTRLRPEDSDFLSSLVARALAAADRVSGREQLALFAQQREDLNSSTAQPDAIRFWFDDFMIEELCDLKQWASSAPSPQSLALAKAALSSIIVAVSRQDSDTRYVRREKNLKPGDAYNRFARALTDAVSASKQFGEIVEERFSCTVVNANLLEAPDTPFFDLVVCSPPYPNAYSYHLYHMTRMLWLEMDPYAFKRIEIGSHRKYSRKGPNKADVETFRSELRTILLWLHHRLRPSRFACFVLGDSILDGNKVNNAEVLASVARETGFIEVKRIHRRLRESRKAFNPAYGKIKTEHILILQNTDREGL
jgi:site-specific DNA-methyltransferase (cytosine-N4-specific)